MVLDSDLLPVEDDGVRKSNGAQWVGDRKALGCEMAGDIGPEPGL